MGKYREERFEGTYPYLMDCMASGGQTNRTRNLFENEKLKEDE